MSTVSISIQDWISGQIVETSPDQVRKSFKGFPPLQSDQRQNFVKFLVDSQLKIFLNHESRTFQEKLEIKGFRRMCHI